MSCYLYTLKISLLNPNNLVMKNGCYFLYRHDFFQLLSHISKWLFWTLYFITKDDNRMELVSYLHFRTTNSSPSSSSNNHCLWKFSDWIIWKSNFIFKIDRIIWKSNFIFTGFWKILHEEEEWGRSHWQKELKMRQMNS